MKKKRKGESGQAIIEFLIVSAMILTLIFMIVQVAWGMAYGHYVHYATYMASRAYLSSGRTQQDQYESAVAVLRTTLKKASGQDLLPAVARARTGDGRDVKGAEPVAGAALGLHSEAQGRPNSRLFSWAEGVQYNYGLKLFLIPLMPFIAKGGEGSTIATGTATEPGKPVDWKGLIPFTSDSYLGREASYDECIRAISRLSTATGIGRADGRDFIEDNGC